MIMRRTGRCAHASYHIPVEAAAQDCPPALEWPRRCARDPVNAPHNVVAASEAASRKQLGKPSGRRESVANPLISVESLTPYGLLFLLVRLSW